MTKLPFHAAATDRIVEPVLVMNVIALRDMQKPLREEVLEAIHQVVATGVRPILSVRDYEPALEHMMRLCMPMMIPDDSKRNRFYHNDQLLFARQELLPGKQGIMKTPHADLYIALDTYAEDIPHLAYIDVKSDNVPERVLRAFGVGGPPQLPGLEPSFSPR